MRARLPQRMFSQQGLQHLRLLLTTPDRPIRILSKYPKPSTSKDKESELTILKVRAEENVDERNLQDRRV